VTTVAAREEPGGHASGREPWGRRLGERVGRGLAELGDRVRASDPGLGRLRQGLAAAVSVGTALPLQTVAGQLAGFTGRAAFTATLFGAVVAMLAANALVGSNDRADKVRSAVFFPVAVGLGLIGAVLTDTERWLQTLGFGVVLFAAVYVRRFGPHFFFYGFMVFMGFFFATFLQASWGVVPELLLAAVISTVWVLLLSVTVFQSKPQAMFESVRRAFYARARSVARASAELLELPAESERHRARALRALSARQGGMAEAALLAEAWSAERGTLPEGWSASAVRRRLIEAQQAMERVAAASHRMRYADPALRRQAHRVVEAVSAHHDAAALHGCERLEADADAFRDRAEVDEREAYASWGAHHIAFGVREFLRFDAAVATPPELDPGEEEFEAATDLVNGSLPGSPAIARDVEARGHRNPLRRATLSTRQAVQVTLAGVIALGLGTALSPVRYYWAILAAFVMFTGTGTRSETFLKGVGRIVGTLVGLVASIWLAHLTAGHDAVVIAVILASVFAMFYLAKVSQAAMTFFITVLLGQLYTVLGTFSDGVLVLRLGETVVGALAGFGVAMLFAPLSTRDTVRSARDEMLDSMQELLEGVAAYAEGSAGRGAGAGARLDALTRALDDRARRLALVARPLVRPLVVGNSSPRTRRRLTLYVTAVSQCRALALAVQRDVAAPGATAAAARALSRAAHALSEQEPGAKVPAAEEPLRDGDLALFGDRAAASADDPVIRHLHHLAATLTQVSQTTPVSSPRTARHRA